MHQAKENITWSLRDRITCRSHWSWESCAGFFLASLHINDSSNQWPEKMDLNLLCKRLLFVGIGLVAAQTCFYLLIYCFFFLSGSDSSNQQFCCCSRTTPCPGRSTLIARHLPDECSSGCTAAPFHLHLAYVITYNQHPHTSSARSGFQSLSSRQGKCLWRCWLPHGSVLSLHASLKLRTKCHRGCWIKHKSYGMLQKKSQLTTPTEAVAPSSMI